MWKLYSENKGEYNLKQRNYIACLMVINTKEGKKKQDNSKSRPQWQKDFWKRDLKNAREWLMHLSTGNVFQANGTASAKAVKQEPAY